MRRLLTDIYYSFPVQLLILHFRKYQVILIFWLILYSAIDSNFMKNFGADALFFVPEYLGEVGPLGAAIVGVAVGIFFMSWNITTFILHSKRFKFLATASKPFLKYCLNNILLPLIFLIFYLVRLYKFNLHQELMTSNEAWLLIAGFMGGLTLHIAFSFAYFFGADRRILRNITPIVTNVSEFKAQYDKNPPPVHENFGLKVGYYITSRFTLRQARVVSHYNQDFLDTIFKRHHFAGMIGIILAFIFLITVGFFLDMKFFQVPAAASIIVFFAIMIAVIGALTYFLQSWSLLFVIALIITLNILYANEIIDPRNKAYGLNYSNKEKRPSYTRQELQSLCTPAAIKEDKNKMIAILENWKNKQSSEKPVMILVNVSGGGLRSATFVMNTLQQIDSITNGQLMQHTFMFSGASGGMLAATYYRELYRRKLKGAHIDLHDKKYLNNITQDLLNPIFSSMIDRDIFAPVQKFSVGNQRYVKDRGYAFEEKLKENTEGILNTQLKDYSKDEQTAKIPMILFNSVVTIDGRKMVLSTQPVSFMMKPAAFANDRYFTPDAVDFSAFFFQQDPLNIRLLTALRMNATFPYVLPNVWLPCAPVVDIMDAGLRDNFGQETTLRFVENFRDWINKNTGGVVILQLHDRVKDEWDSPSGKGSISDILVKPATMIQRNWYKLQDYFQTDQYAYSITDTGKIKMHRITFTYTPEKAEMSAALNFHLTAAEKKDVITSFNKPYNQKMLKELLTVINKN
ncbi:MAG: hypothetical protein HY305_01380 [Sphingobacteriales bacterium]|nr:hypothetical protein [Sphingobacteriales bacterium]